MKRCLQILLYIKYLSIIGIKANPLIGITEVKPAERNEFPSMVSLGYPPYDSSAHICSGVLISKTNVLTVEDCFHNIDLLGLEIKDLKATVGTNNLRRFGHEYHVEDVIPYHVWASKHPNDHDFDDTIPHNIAVVKLTGEVHPRHGKPVKIFNENWNDLANKPLETVGFGNLRYPSIFGRILNKATVHMIREQDARQNYITARKNQNRARNHIATRNRNEAVSYGDGDSGGPLLYNGQLLGINDKGLLNEGATGPPHVHLEHLSALYYRPFIREYAEIPEDQMGETSGTSSRNESNDDPKGKGLKNIMPFRFLNKTKPRN